MVWCSYCGKDQVVEQSEGFVCCTGCGRVLDDQVFSSEPTFTKGNDGRSQFAGNIVKQSQYGSYARIVDSGNGKVSGYQSNSHQRTLDKGRQEIKDIANLLSVSGGDETVSAAHRFYIIAVERNFTKGRRTNQVAAACLYIVCRQCNKPFLLIDFSDCLQMSVYHLGGVFLQLCSLLRLEQHAMVQKPVDPSLFIHRFTDRLIQKTASETPQKTRFAIANTALRIVASMKQDWIQTGRRPSGICGAALLLSMRIHGLECSKSDVESVVYVCKATISKRLLEFSNTEAGTLTPEEFEARARQKEQELALCSKEVVNCARPIKEILCEHKDSGGKHHAHGLCKTCYDDFIKISGGLQGSAPPAFQKAESERQRQLKGKRKADQLYLQQSGFDDDEISKAVTYMEYTTSGRTKIESCIAEAQCSDNSPANHVDEGPESLSDLDEDEIETYLNTEEEVKLKTIVWTEMNKEYLEEQEAKEAVLQAQAESMAVVSSTGTAAEIAAATVVLARKARKHKNTDSPSKPAETPAEATRQMLEKKRLSSKLNYSVLEKMFNEDEQTTSKPEAKLDVAEENEKQEIEEEEGDEEAEYEGEVEEDVPSYSHIYEQAVDEEEYYEEY